MQAKDVPDRPVLEFLSKLNGKWGNWLDLKTEATLEIQYQGRSVLRAMPEGTPQKVALAKMNALIRRGLATGCCCGCRGDFEITAAGEKFLKTVQP